jgi:hypothetical protein
LSFFTPLRLCVFALNRQKPAPPQQLPRSTSPAIRTTHEAIRTTQHATLQIFKELIDRGCSQSRNNAVVSASNGIDHLTQFAVVNL